MGAATGIVAANTVLSARGHATEPVWSVPLRGMLVGRLSGTEVRLFPVARPAQRGDRRPSLTH
jgi:hypothetical protein